MARLSATPNPVGVYSPAVGSTTIIEWDTEIVGTAGKVFVSVNGADEDEVAGQAAGGARRGSLQFQVTTPNSYRLSLRRASNMAELASIVVATFDLRQQLAAGFAASYLPQLRPQMITQLVVKTGIDTVHISFRTTRPTIPTTELRDDSGAWVDGRMPLFAGLQTRHAAVFGIERPLALNTKHTFRIEAFGPTGDQATPNKVLVTGEFITGTRSADVMFETVNVHDDGDPGPRGAGEFRFSFGVGDTSTGDLLGAPAFWPDRGEAGIDEDDPPIDIGKTISIGGAPRQLWVQVNGQESDSTILPWEAGIGFGMRPTFDPPGSSYIGAGDAQAASVTIFADIDTDPGRWMIPFKMATGDYPVDFVVTGHIAVSAFVGSYMSPKIGKLGTLPQSSAFLTEPGSIRALAVGGVGERTDLIALGADGGFYHRSLNRERQASGGEARWTRVELPSAAQVTVAASRSGMLNIVAVNADGAVTHREFDPAAPKRGRWRKLGGRFREVHAAAESGLRRGTAAKLLLFGLSQDGGLHVRDTDADGGDWSRLGDVPVRAIAADVDRAAVFAVAEDRSLLAFERDMGRWRQHALTRVPGEVPTQLLTVVSIDQVDSKSGKISRDLVIGAMDGDRHVRTLRWPNYPAGSAELKWEEVGPVQELLVAQRAPSQKRRRTSSKSK